MKNNAGILVRTGEEKAEVTIFLPQSLMFASLPTLLEWMDIRMRTGGAKFLPLSELMTT